MIYAVISILVTTQTREKMAQQFLHPAALIVQARTNFEFTEKRISTKLRPNEFSIVKEEIEKRIRHYNCLTNAAITCHNLQSDTDIQSYQDDGRRQILLSTLSLDFLGKYNEEIHYEKTYSDLLKFISDTIGIQSEKQKTEEAEERLSSVTRHISDDEKFERLLERIKRIAKNASNNTDVQNYLVEAAFRKNLSTRHISFLREHEKTDLSIEKVAKYLDKMKKNVRESSVNSLELSSTNNKISELYEQNFHLQTSNNELHKKFDTLQTEMERLMAMLQGQASQIQSTPTNKEINHIKGKSQANFQKRNWIKPKITCEKCGLWGHKEGNCWGPKCPICKKDGHSKFICPQEPQLSKNL